MEISRTVRNRRVSGRQLEMLWEFLNSNRDIAVSYNRSLQAKEYSQRKWREITEYLNAQGDGVHKDWRGWSKYWVDYKAKLKTRVAAVRSSQQRTGGGPSTEKPLTESEEKFLQILGEDLGQGLSGIRVKPFVEPPTSGNASGLDVVIYSIEQPLPVENAPVPQSPNRSPHATPPSACNPHLATPPAARSSPHTATPSAARSSPRRGRRRRRELPMSRESARRALVLSSQMRAEAAVQSSQALERMVSHMEAIQNSILRIERVLNDAFPRAAGPGNSA